MQHLASTMRSAPPSQGGRCQTATARVERLRPGWLPLVSLPPGTLPPVLAVHQWQQLRLSMAQRSCWMPKKLLACCWQSVDSLHCHQLQQLQRLLQARLLLPELPDLQQLRGHLLALGCCPWQGHPVLWGCHPGCLLHPTALTWWMPASGRRLCCGWLSAATPSCPAAPPL